MDEMDFPEVLLEIPYVLTEDGEPLWITNDGDEIPISQMTDRHLLNAHRLVRGSDDVWDERWLYALWLEIRLRGLKPLPAKEAER